MIFILFFIAAVANGMMDLIDMKPERLSWLPMGAFRVWLLGNKVYAKKWMYPFLMPLADGWHFFKGVMVVAVVCMVTTEPIEVIILFFVWMTGHEVIFAADRSRPT